MPRSGLAHFVRQERSDSTKCDKENIRLKQLLGIIFDKILFDGYYKSKEVNMIKVKVTYFENGKLKTVSISASSESITAVANVLGVATSAIKTIVRL